MSMMTLGFQNSYSMVMHMINMRVNFLLGDLIICLPYCLFELFISGRNAILLAKDRLEKGLNWLDRV
jgi:F0F1-type ATP synthase assembly protein I